MSRIPDWTLKTKKRLRPPNYLTSRWTQVPRKTKAFVLSDFDPSSYTPPEPTDGSKSIEGTRHIFLCTFAIEKNGLSPAEKIKTQKRQTPKTDGLDACRWSTNSITSPEIKYIFQIRDITTPEFFLQQRKITDKKEKVWTRRHYRSQKNGTNEP